MISCPNRAVFVPSNPGFQAILVLSLLLALVLAGCISVERPPVALNQYETLEPAISEPRQTPPPPALEARQAEDPAPKVSPVTTTGTNLEIPSPLINSALSEPEISISEEIRSLAELGKWEKGLPTGPGADGEEALYDFPVTLNKQVEFYLDFFKTRHRKHFERWLSRSGRYLPMVQQELAEAGLPLDLAYLPLIESGYSLDAVSSAKAVGPWQFMSATGRHYGLTVNEYIDERRDPVKSTKAAVTYLSNLYQEFSSWHLAVAAYNAGEGRIRKAIKQSETDDFWELANGNYIHPETRLYVPKLIAAIMIAREPEKYGFDRIDYELPLEYEEVFVPRQTSLQAVALAGKLSVDTINRLNPELCRGITPPNRSSYPLRIPPGTKELVEKNLPRVKKVVTTRYRKHVVEKKETLSSISRRYGLSAAELRKLNGLSKKKKKLAAGTRLKVPYRVVSYRLDGVEQEAEKSPQLVVAALPAPVVDPPKERLSVSSRKDGKKSEKGKGKEATPSPKKDGKKLVAAGKSKVGGKKETGKAEKNRSKPRARSKKHKVPVGRMKSLKHLDG